MAKMSSMYVCQQCGFHSSQFLGRCPECGTWNSLVEEQVIDKPANKLSKSKKSAEIVNLNDIKKEDYDRLTSGLDEFDRVLGGGIVSGSVVLVSGEPGIGKCVSGSTRIIDPNTGAFLPITAWKKNKRSVLALDEKQARLIPRQVSAFHTQGVRDVVELRTRLGHTLRCTPNHPVWTPIGWCPVSELSIGTRIATPRTLPFFGQNVMPENEIKLIAYILSDGSSRGAISVTSIIPEIALDLSGVAEAFGMQLRIYSKKNTLAKEFRFIIPHGYRKIAREKFKATLWEVHDATLVSWQGWARAAEVSYGQLNDWRRAKAVPSKIALQRLASAVNLPIEKLAPEERDIAELATPTARFLDSVGMRKIKAKDKSIPECIFQLPKHQIALFLKILFSCDGSIYITSGNIPALSYSTISHQLANDVQHLLLRFGLVAKLRTKDQLYKEKPYISYELQMLGLAGVKRFLLEIGIWGRTETKVMMQKLSMPRLPSTHFDTIPIGPKFWEELQYVAGSTSFKLISRNAGVRLSSRRLDRPLTRFTLEAIANKYPSSYIHSLAFGDIYWDEVVSIASAGKEMVYDLTVPESANFVANDLIVHNSTLLSQLALNVPNTLYVAGEESARQIKIRIDRIKRNASLNILQEIDVDTIITSIEQTKPALVIIDSIQTLETADLNSPPGSVGQVRESAHRLQRLAKNLHIPIFIVGHITKEGTIAGPKTLEHLVDVVLNLEGEPSSNFRVLRGAKNRFGPTDEVGIFEMEETGMVEVKNPSKIFLDQKVNAPGSAVIALINGIRPLLVEVQALVTKSNLPIPKRVGSGIDNNRLQLLVAVISRRLNISLYDQDIFINVTGGLKVFEPAADLGICLAIISSLQNKTIPEKTVMIGEVGLLGELRAVRQIDKRSSEAKKLGYQKIISPNNIKTLNEAVRKVLDTKT